MTLRLRAYLEPKVKGPPSTLSFEAAGTHDWAPGIIKTTIPEWPQSLPFDSIDLYLLQSEIDLELVRQSTGKKTFTRIVDAGRGQSGNFSTVPATQEETQFAATVLKTRSKWQIQGKPVLEVAASVKGRIRDAVNKQIGIDASLLSKTGTAGQRSKFQEDLLRASARATVAVWTSTTLKFKDSLDPTNAELVNALFQTMKDAGYEYPLAEYQKEEAAIVAAFKKLLAWHIADTSVFWKEWALRGSTLDPNVPQELKTMYELGILAEYFYMSRLFEEYNPRKRTWIWNDLNDRTQLISQVREVLQNKGFKGVAEFMADFQYRNNVSLPRFIALDVAASALYNQLDVRMGG